MELFNKNKNKSYTYCRRLINTVLYDNESDLRDPDSFLSEFRSMMLDTDTLIKNNTLSATEKRLSELAIFTTVDGKIMPTLNNQSVIVEDDVISDLIEQGYAAPPYVPIMLTTLEKRYLKTILNDPLISCFFPEGTKNQLIEDLKDVQAFPFDTLFHYTDDPKLTLTEELYQRIHCLSTAHRKQEKITYKYVGRDNVEYNATATVYKLYYSLPTKLWQTLLWIDSKKLLVTCNLENFIEIKHTNLRGESLPSIKDFLSFHEKTLELKLYEIHSSIERTFLLFSDYDKKANFNSSDNIYSISLTYYDFEEKNIIKDILSLGDAVEVISPLHVRNEIIERIRKIKLSN